MVQESKKEKFRILKRRYYIIDTSDLLHLQIIPLSFYSKEWAQFNLKRYYNTKTHSIIKGHKIKYLSIELRGTQSRRHNSIKIENYLYPKSHKTAQRKKTFRTIQRRKTRNLKAYNKPSKYRTNYTSYD